MRNRKLATIRIVDILIEGRILVKPKQRLVDEIKASIAEVGLIEPIIVRKAAARGKFVLVAGRQRLEASAQLGHGTIAALIDTTRGDPLDRRAMVIQIDENLKRRTLTDTERAHLVLERKRLYEEKHPDAKVGNAQRLALKRRAKGIKPESGVKVRSFIEAEAASTGRSLTQIKRDARHAEILGVDALQRLTGTCLDKGIELDALCNMPEAERTEYIELAASGTYASAVQFMRNMQRNEGFDEDLQAIKIMWDRLGDESRQKFLQYIGLEPTPRVAADASPLAAE